MGLLVSLLHSSRRYNGILGEFYDQMQPMATRIPYMLGPGNHEWPCNYYEYAVRQQAMPYAASGANATGNNFYYSYNWGQVHVVTLSGELHNGGIKVGSAQHAWLEADLKLAHARKRNGTIAWIVVTLHYPLYCSSTKSYCCAQGCNEARWWTVPQVGAQSYELRASLEAMLNEYEARREDVHFDRSHFRNLQQRRTAEADGS